MQRERRENGGRPHRELWLFQWDRGRIFRCEVGTGSVFLWDPEHGEIREVEAEEAAFLWRVDPPIGLDAWVMKSAASYFDRGGRGRG